MPSIVSQVDDIGRYIGDGLDQVLGWLTSGPLKLDQADIDKAVDRALRSLKDNAGEISGGLIAGVGLATEIITGVLLAVVVVFFFVHDGRAI